jgi:non-heme chloroperoxidase
MPFVTTRDKVDIFYNDWGSGRPVVLIHGWPVNHGMWEYQTASIVEAGFRVVAYDRRGFGASSQPFGGYDYDTFADDLAAVIDTLSLEDAVLVGFSMGGGEIARYFARHGGKGVAKAIFVGAVPPYLLKTDDNPDGVDGSVFEGIVDGLKRDRPAFLAGFAKSFFNAGMLNFQISDAIMGQFVTEALKASPKATIDCVGAFARTDFRADLAAIRVPTLVIHGDSDKTVPIEASGRRTAEAVAGAHLAVYENAPHALYFTDKERLTADIVSFARV